MHMRSHVLSSSADASAHEEERQEKRIHGSRVCAQTNSRGECVCVGQLTSSRITRVFPAKCFGSSFQRLITHDVAPAFCVLRSRSKGKLMSTRNHSLWEDASSLPARVPVSLLLLLFACVDQATRATEQMAQAHARREPSTWAASSARRETSDRPARVHIKGAGLQSRVERKRRLHERASMIVNAKRKRERHSRREEEEGEREAKRLQSRDS